jgi:hypothetical protein
MILVDNTGDLPPSTLFKLNVYQLELAYFCVLVQRVWNLSPRLVGEQGCILWWEVVVCHIKFMRGCGWMMTCK